MDRHELINIFERKFKMNSFMRSTLVPDNSLKDYKGAHNNAHLGKEFNDGLHHVCSLYMYTNSPPYGYGTPAPKVAETIQRAYEYDRKETEETEIIMGIPILLTAIHNLNDFPFKKTTGNFHPGSVKLMSQNYRIKNNAHIIKCFEKTIDFAKRTNPDILTQGRQTWDPESAKSITSAKAYARWCFLLKNNGINQPTNCLEFIRTFFQLYEKTSIITKQRTAVTKTKKYYSKKHSILMERKIKRFVVKAITIEGLDNVQRFLFDYLRSFCSYIKHAERGKKDRRAIASANPVLRCLLLIVEHFHLELGKLVEGNTISIGGDEKKRKIITQLLASSEIQNATSSVELQATEDATKWNECLNPLMFNIMHNVFFDDNDLLQDDNIHQREDLKLLKKICNFTFLVLACKRIHMGPGLTLENEEEFRRMDWDTDPWNLMNIKNREMFASIQQHYDGNGYMNVSPGFLMGMLNAASTTVGLIPIGFLQPPESKVTTLRSSDDSMTVFSSTTIDTLLDSILLNKYTLKSVGINQSEAKTLLCRKSFGEYTSWYQDEEFTGQYGVETSSLKPGGNNAQDDFNTIAKETGVLLRSYAINNHGAWARLLIGIDNVRRLWKIDVNPNKRDPVSRNIIFLADGGRSPWDLENLFIDESTIRWKAAINKLDKEYILKVMNPSNPFSDTPEERIMYSRSKGTVVSEDCETPRNVFCYIRRSNKTCNNLTSQIEAESERNHAAALEIIMASDPSLYLKTPKTRNPVIDFVKSSLALMSQTIVLSEEEKEMYEEAKRKMGDEGSQVRHERGKKRYLDVEDL